MLFPFHPRALEKERRAGAAKSVAVALGRDDADAAAASRLELIIHGVFKYVPGIGSARINNMQATWQLLPPSIPKAPQPLLSIGASRRWRRADSLRREPLRHGQGEAAASGRRRGRICVVRVRHGGCHRPKLRPHGEARQRAEAGSCCAGEARWLPAGRASARQRAELLRRGRCKAAGGSAQARSTSAWPALELSEMRSVLICRRPPTPRQIEEQPSTSSKLLGASVKHDQIPLPSRRCSQPDPAVPKVQPDATALNPGTSVEKTSVAPYCNGKNCRTLLFFNFEIVLQLKVNSKASMDAIHFRLKSLI
ncbi:hypothetical protein EJB05_53420, partial [Eragrostis curvula]